MEDLTITLVRTHDGDPRFRALVQFLDAELAERDGEDHGFYAQYNTIDHLRHVVIALEGGGAVGCGAIKEIGPRIMEVKRMYTVPQRRGKGIAARVLSELEAWALLLGYTGCRLETGKRQQEAIRLYQKNGYRIIPNYGQYAGIENSVCFEKSLLQNP